MLSVGVRCKCSSSWFGVRVQVRVLRASVRVGVNVRVRGAVRCARSVGVLSVSGSVSVECESCVAVCVQVEV